jgi:hypothetical protein
MEKFVCPGCPFNTWCKSDDFECVPDIFDETEVEPTRNADSLDTHLQELLDKASAEVGGWIF